MPLLRSALLLSRFYFNATQRIESAGINAISSIPCSSYKPADIVAPCVPIVKHAIILNVFRICEQGTAFASMQLLSQISSYRTSVFVCRFQIARQSAHPRLSGNTIADTGFDGASGAFSPIGYEEDDLIRSLITNLPLTTAIQFLEGFKTT